MLFLPNSLHVGQEKRKVVSSRAELCLDIINISSDLIVVVKINGSNLREEIKPISVDLKIFSIGLIKTETAPYFLVNSKDEISGAETSRDVLKTSNII